MTRACPQAAACGFRPWARPAASRWVAGGRPPAKGPRAQVAPGLGRSFQTLVSLLCPVRPPPPPRVSLGPYASPPPSCAPGLGGWDLGPWVPGSPSVLRTGSFIWLSCPAGPSRGGAWNRGRTRRAGRQRAELSWGFLGPEAAKSLPLEASLLRAPRLQVHAGPGQQPA